MFPENVNRDLPPVSDWQVESFRLTAFPSPAAQIESSTWWSDIVGEAPDISINLPKKGEVQFRGQLRVGKLTLQTQPTRIEWLLRATDQQKESEPFSTTGPFPEILGIFSPLMLRWFELDTCPLIQRLAFGAVLAQTVEDRRVGYRQIARYLHSIQFDPDNSSDLLYQINRPRRSNSGIQDLDINRLSKWGVAMYQHFETIFEPVAVRHLPPSLEGFACRLELDINTSQYFQGELSREQLPQVFQELVHLGREIAQEGDIP